MPTLLRSELTSHLSIPDREEEAAQQKSGIVNNTSYLQE